MQTVLVGIGICIIACWFVALHARWRSRSPVIWDDYDFGVIAEQTSIDYTTTGREIE